MQLFSFLIGAANMVTASRLHHFKAFHRGKQNQISTVRQHLCTAQICQKCVQAFVFGHERAMKTICKSIVKTKGCCPTKHFVKSHSLSLFSWLNYPTVKLYNYQRLLSLVFIVLRKKCKNKWSKLFLNHLIRIIR